MKFCDKVNADVSLRTECKSLMRTKYAFYDKVNLPYALNTYKTNNIRMYYDSNNIENTKQTGGANVDQINDNDKILGGENDKYEYDELVGGTNDIFKNSTSMYLLADVTNRNVLNDIYARIAKLNISQKLLKGVIPHISLMQIIINTSNKDHQILMIGKNVNPHLQMSMNIQYNKVSPQIYISSPKGGYEIMGDFFAKVYTPSNSTYISLFRTHLYKYIEGFLGKGQRRIVVVNNKKYFVYSYRGRDLLAVPDYYHGRGIWKPHLSIIKLDKIYKSNPRLYSQYLKYGKISLINAMYGVKGSISSFNLHTHFGRLRITAR